MTEARVPVFTLGERIVKAYKDLGWSQARLALRLGVDRKTLGNWIAGRHRPSYADLVAVAAVTGVSADWLVGDFYDGGGVPNPHDRNPSTLRYSAFGRVVDAVHPLLLGETTEARDYELAA
jgi:transcriptional regulator with XRE-family HTH domain